MKSSNYVRKFHAIYGSMDQLGRILRRISGGGRDLLEMPARISTNNSSFENDSKRPERKHSARNFLVNNWSRTIDSAPSSCSRACRGLRSSLSCISELDLSAHPVARLRAIRLINQFAYERMFFFLVRLFLEWRVTDNDGERFYIITIYIK